MPKCPECGENISYVEAIYSKGRACFVVKPRFNSDGTIKMVEENENDLFDSNDYSFETYQCPECNEELGFHGDDLNKFFSKTRCDEKVGD
jgi:predicted RNA-binding Zn-ribbon protein involved in translation (DUF1610 family)